MSDLADRKCQSCNQDTPKLTNEHPAAKLDRAAKRQ
jgi:hypothetical protein